jgi:hypothetical protein
MCRGIVLVLYCFPPYSYVIQIPFMHKLRAVIVVILFTDISIFSNEDMLFRPFGFLAPKDM